MQRSASQPPGKQRTASHSPEPTFKAPGGYKPAAKPKANAKAAAQPPPAAAQPLAAAAQPVASRPARPTSAPAPKTRLVPTTVYVRVRPFATEGGHTAGKAVQHRIDGWDEYSVSMTSSSGRRIFNFPTKVVLPEATQQEAWDLMLPSLLDAWMTRSNNLMVLAYGQTGTGKTHTMFGSKESLKAEGMHPDWGVLPRAVHSVFELMETNRGRVSYILTGSALEFYAGVCMDLLNHHSFVEINASGESQGQEMRVLEDMNGFYAFLEDVESNRTTAATKMNSASSRSHCAMLLTLFQLDHESQRFTATKFNLFDLAGSERVDKTGEERFSGMEVYNIMADAMKGGKNITSIPLGAQAMMINFELSALTSEIQKATDQHKRGAKYAPPRSMSTAFQRYTGAIMSGRTLLTTVICISPAPQNGSENLFSLKWGQDMAKLKAPNVREVAVPVDQAYKTTVANAKAYARELAGKLETNKFYSAYKTRSDAAAQTVVLLERLMTAVSC